MSQPDKTPDYLAEFIAGTKKPDRRIFGQSAKEKMVADFKEQANSKYQRWRATELHASFSQILKKVEGKALDRGLFDSMHEALDTVFQIWVKQWVKYPLGDMEYSYSVTFSQRGVELSYGPKLAQLFTGVSDLDAVAGHPLAWSEFVEFIRDAG